MRTLGMTMDSHLAGLTSRLPEDAVQTVRDVDCNADIYATQVFLAYRSALDAEHPARPYMHIIGECRAIRGNIPCGVKEVRFAEGEGVPVDILYEFGNEELSEMVMKGMYDAGFKCPEIITDNVLEMPVYCNFKVVAPQSEKDTPIVFADIADRRCIEVSEETCGYRFGDYFEEAVQENVQVYDDFEAYDDYEQEDLFADEHAAEIEDSPEAAPRELSLREQAIEAHYENIRNRVIHNHILQNGGLTNTLDKARVPRKELLKHDEMLNQKDDEQFDEVDALVASVAANTVMHAPAYDEQHFEEPQYDDTSDVDDIDEMDGVSDMEDHDAYSSVEDELAMKAEADVKSENKRQVAVDDNVDANDGVDEDDLSEESEDIETKSEFESEKQPMHHNYDVPEHLQRIADRYDSDKDDDFECI